MHTLSGRLLTTLIALSAAMMPSDADAQPPAKQLFGKQKLPAVQPAAAHGFYSKGCMSGAIGMPIDGPTWQTMRLSRNRRWGHPDTIKTLVKLSVEGQKVGWNGLLVGDISQPRGGPMLTGHASHQIGLDADIWLTPMPDKRLTRREREQLSATSVLKRRANGRLDPNRIGSHFTAATFGIIKTAANYGEVERVLVHPTIKRELCKRAGTDRGWLSKVRPYWGHHYHMHIRLSCPTGSPNCRPQAKPKANDGCGSELAYWHRLLNPIKRKPKPKVAKPAKPKVKKRVVKRKPKRQIVLTDLPGACVGVLQAAPPVDAKSATLQMAAGQAFVPTLKPAAKFEAFDIFAGATVPLPSFRPVQQ
ncbi:MAG: penicillin-insensitive murein endopeptidase [Pseudomonadota bacterium]